VAIGLAILLAVALVWMSLRGRRRNVPEAGPSNDSRQLDSEPYDAPLGGGTARSPEAVTSFTARRGSRVGSSW
jgi:hypothetical protein